MKKSLFDQRHEKIKTHILDPENSPLSLKDQELLDRVISASKLLDQYPLKKHAVALHQKKFPEISRTQAYQDLTLASKLYLSFQDFDYDFWQTWLINDIIKNIQKCENHDTAQHRKIISAEHTNLIKAIGKKPESVPDPSRFEKHQYNLLINLGNSKVELDLNKLKELPNKTLNELNKALIGGREITVEDAKEIIDS